MAERETTHGERESSSIVDRLLAVPVGDERGDEIDRAQFRRSQVELTRLIQKVLHPAANERRDAA
jgi:hypothetical protein